MFSLKVSLFSYSEIVQLFSMKNGKENRYVMLFDGQVLKPI